MILNKARMSNLLRTNLLNITNKSCYKGTEILQMHTKRIKQNALSKKIILKGNIATNYIK